MILLILPCFLIADDGKRTILQTSDSHGRINASAAVKAVYATYDSADSLIIDCGDTLQGTYSAMTDGGHDVIKSMNLLGYDVWVSGNHDLDYGEDVFLKRTAEFDGSVLCGNLVLN